MKAIKTLIIWTDETRKEKIANDIGLLSKLDISDRRYDNLINVEDINLDIILIDLHQCDEQAEGIAQALTKVKENFPKTIMMLSGKISNGTKKVLQDVVDIISGVTSVKIKKDYRSCLNLLITKKYKLNYLLTSFFAPHLVGDLEVQGFELVVNETYHRDTYKENFIELWRSYILAAPLLTESNRKILEGAIYAYEERGLTREESNAIRSEFFFQFNTLPSLGNFSERRLYYMERSVIEEVWTSVIDFARSVDNSLLFGCYKTQNYVRLKVVTHRAYSLKKITKSSEIYQILSMIVPYGDVVITSGGERMVIDAEPEIDISEDISDAETDPDTLTFNFYIKVILPHRRHRGLRRYSQ